MLEPDVFWLPVVLLQVDQANRLTGDVRLTWQNMWAQHSNINNTSLSINAQLLLVYGLSTPRGLSSVHW